MSPSFTRLAFSGKEDIDPWAGLWEAIAPPSIKTDPSQCVKIYKGTSGYPLKRLCRQDFHIRVLSPFALAVGFYALAHSQQ